MLKARHNEQKNRTKTKQHKQGMKKERKVKHSKTKEKLQNINIYLVYKQHRNVTGTETKTETEEKRQTSYNTKPINSRPNRPNTKTKPAEIGQRSPCYWRPWCRHWWRWSRRPATTRWTKASPAGTPALPQGPSPGYTSVVIRCA